ncbi:MAG: hypothetical protein A2033_09875 [Bacteroidetes bacterium GWA2_31_9]|nr:MAG: hypothetical protein A2033_09875 [Bacteroidetes bacterium GWA2_31_9]
MKKIVLIVFLSCLITKLTSQELKLQTNFNHNNLITFQDDIGYGIGYNEFHKSKNKYGITFSLLFNKRNYSYSYSSNSDGNSYYRTVKPNNIFLSFVINYSFNIINSKNNKLFVGPLVSLNYLNTNESIIESKENDNQYKFEFHSNYWAINKLGIGSIIEYERIIIPDKFSLSLSSSGGLIHFYSIRKVELSFPSVPFCYWLNLNLNFIYYLTVNKSKYIENN